MTTEDTAKRQSMGIDKIRMFLREDFFNLLDKHNNIPMDIKECQALQDITKQASIGQLWTLANLREDKLTSIKLLSLDADGTIYLTFCGMYGGMDLLGIINT